MVDRTYKSIRINTRLNWLIRSDTWGSEKLKAVSLSQSHYTNTTCSDLQAEEWRDREEGRGTERERKREEVEQLEEKQQEEQQEQEEEQEEQERQERQEEEEQEQEEWEEQERQEEWEEEEEEEEEL